MCQNSILSWTQRLVTLRIVTVRAFEDIDVCALHPICANRRIDGGLHITTVEIDLRSWRKVVTWIDNPKDVEKMRACVEDVVDVKAWINFKRRGEYVVEKVAV